jgi:hypothetical protein
MTRRGLLLIAFLLLSASCLGDQSHEVTLVNETGINVTVYPYGRRQSQFNHVMSPGSRASEQVMTDTSDSTSVAYVEAVTDSGVVVFCRAYTVGQLKKLDWQIRVTRGSPTC